MTTHAVTTEVDMRCGTQATAERVSQHQDTAYRGGFYNKVALVVESLYAINDGLSHSSFKLSK